MPHSNRPTTRDIKDRRNGRAKTSERTAPQIHIAAWGVSQPELPTRYPVQNWFHLVREMRKDPTLSLVRDLVVGPIVASEWSVGHTKDAPKGAVELVRNNIEALRTYLVINSLTGWLDFGWQTFEKVWAIDKNNRTVIDKVKPLLQDITKVLVSTKTGEFLGTIQDSLVNQKSEVIKVEDDLVFGTGMLRAKDVILTNINVEGTYWYGRPIMGNALIPYKGWNTVNESADRYDRKIAGSHWVIHYPYGTSVLNGVKQDNFNVAQALINDLESSGAITVPRQVDQTVKELNTTGANNNDPDAWKIELLSDSSSQQSNFIDRLKYYDALKVRALGFPERSIIEGSFGTKAEAQVHADAAVLIADYRHIVLTEQMSYQLVNDLMKYNYGVDTIGTVFLKPAPISDDLKIFLRQIFLTLMQHAPEVALQKVNADEVKEKLGLPKNDNEGDDSEFDFPDPVEVIGGGSGNPTNPITGRPGSTKLNPVKGEVTKI